jgi:enamine deaminase RidA (YjgF/YER057c/UK114 family)
MFMVRVVPGIRILGLQQTTFAQGERRHKRRSARLNSRRHWRSIPNLRTCPHGHFALGSDGPFVTSINRKGSAAVNPEIKIYNLRELGTPLGQYSQVARVKASEFLFIAGMVATDAMGHTVGEGDFFAQCKQTFANVEVALRSANAGWDSVVQFTTYLVHSQDIAKFMDFRRREFPSMFKNGVYPPNTLLMIDRLVKESFLIEVQTVAAL